MTALARRRARIAEVRRVQHLQTAVAAADAETRVLSLETSSERLARLRSTLTPAAGVTFGAALAGVSELSMRLDEARTGLTPAIRAARMRAAEAELDRVAARQRQEGADRLHDRARAEIEAERERRLAALPIRRRAKPEDTK